MILFESVTDTLVEGDIGAQFAFEIEDRLRAECKKRKVEQQEQVLQVLYDILRPFAGCFFMPEKDKTSVYLLLG